MSDCIPNAPLFRDPMLDGASDPTVVWNKNEKEWWIFYTARRAFSPELEKGYSYMHGTGIGIASSGDGGKSWVYRGQAAGLCFEPGTNTYWAPEILLHEGIYHMYVSYVRGVPCDWEHPRKILHYTSRNLWDWQFESVLKLSSDRVIDACVLRISDGRWKMWYKDERHGSFSHTAYSSDLYQWEAGPAEITDVPHEGPYAFFFGGKYWMITDTWNGIGVYRSEDAEHWTRCRDILADGGIRPDDGAMANHASVLVHKGRAYIFYFTHPEVTPAQRKNPDFHWEYRHRRTSLQAAELTTDGENLFCDRNNVHMDLN